MGRKLSSPQRRTSVLLKAESLGWAQCPVAAQSPCFAPWDVCNQKESPAQITVFNQSGRKMICTSLSLPHIPGTVSLHAYYLCQSCQGHDERNWEPSRSRHSGERGGGMSSLQAQQPDSVSMGTLLWPLGCCWHHLMYIFRHKTSPFISEIVFNWLNNTKGRLLSPTENIEHTLSFAFDSSRRKLKLLTHSTLRCRIKTELFCIVGENCDCCEQRQKRSLLIFSTSFHAIVSSLKIDPHCVWVQWTS